VTRTDVDGDEFSSPFHGLLYAGVQKLDRWELLSGACTILYLSLSLYLSLATTLSRMNVITRPAVFLDRTFARCPALVEKAATEK